MRKLTTEEFIEKAREVHGDKYDYSRVVYIDSKTNVCIVCPEHGEFYKTPSNLLKGQGCPKCNKKSTLSMTTEEFIEKAREVHGDKYDYSKVNYVNSKTKVCIICPEHGEFLVNPYSHLKGMNCSKCVGGVKLTTEEFIEKAREVHGDKYDYSRVVYKNSHEKVTIICPEHGPFEISPSAHLSGQNCSKCVGGVKLTTEEFISKLREVHGDKYDYSKVVYKNSHEKVTIICPEHGPFEISPNVLLRGGGCQKCATMKRAILKREKSSSEFISKAREVHGDKYDYSKVEYVNCHTEICIICPEHGEFFQKPTNHLQGAGCYKCAKSGIKLTTEEFIEKAREVHGDKYDYSRVEYHGRHNKVTIICPEHGPFEQECGSHLCGGGCPNCKGLTKSYKFNLLEEFENEFELKSFLLTNDINILHAIAQNILPGSKYEPLQKDIEKALNGATNGVDPLKALEEKYRVEEDDSDINNNIVETNDSHEPIDWDLDDDTDDIDDDSDDNNVEQTDPTIADIIDARERELSVINKVEHLLTPEIKEYILEKFKNDKLREFMLSGEIK